MATATAVFTVYKCSEASHARSRPCSSNLHPVERPNRVLPALHRPIKSPIGLRSTLRVVAETAAEKDKKAAEKQAEGNAKNNFRKQWNAATVVSSDQVAPGIRKLVLDIETSREVIALEEAYTCAGQMAQVKENASSSRVLTAPVMSAPFSHKANWPVIYKMRGDINAGMSKAFEGVLSSRQPLELLVTEGSQGELYRMQQGAEVMVGPFSGNQNALRPLLFISKYRTVLILASGAGIAAANAIIMAKDVGSLDLAIRDDARLYYYGAAPDQILFQDQFAEWEAAGVKVRTVVKRKGSAAFEGVEGTLSTLFEADDLEYDPANTGVIVSGDKEFQKQAKAMVKLAEIPESHVVTLSC
eukprot:jgi/Mesvir1/17877/Mv12953-RA.1